MASNIDLKNKTITGKSGKIYHIKPESITAGRWAEYEILAIELSFSIDFKTLLERCIEGFNALTNGNDILGAIEKAKNNYKAIISGVQHYAESPIPQIIKFASLFCVAEGEDLTNHNGDIPRAKLEDWSEIPMTDFFFLCGQVLPQFKEALQQYNNQIAEISKSNQVNSLLQTETK